MRVTTAEDMGLVVRERRHTLGLTQTDLASSAKVSS